MYCLVYGDSSDEPETVDGRRERDTMVLHMKQMTGMFSMILLLTNRNLLGLYITRVIYNKM